MFDFIKKYKKRSEEEAEDRILRDDERDIVYTVQDLVK